VATPSGAPVRSRAPRGPSRPPCPRARRGDRSPELQVPALGPRAKPGPRPPPPRLPLAHARTDQHSCWDWLPGPGHRANDRTPVRPRRPRALAARPDRRTGPHHRSLVRVPRRHPRPAVVRRPPMSMPGRGGRRTGDLVWDRRPQWMRGLAPTGQPGRPQGSTQQQVAPDPRPPCLVRSLRRPRFELPARPRNLAAPDAQARLAARQAAPPARAGRQARRADPSARSPARSRRRDREGSQSRDRDRRTPSRPRSALGLGAPPGLPSSRRQGKTAQATRRARVTQPVGGPGSARRAEGLPPEQGRVRRRAAPRSAVPRASR
jgi:hypothetical protein